MGMAASQARYLALVARKSNCEYEGQQINQSRLNLSNKSASLFSQVLGLSVPIPPSKQDYMKVQYSFNDGTTDFAITDWQQIAGTEDNNYIITYHYDTIEYQGSQKLKSNPQVRFKGTGPVVSQNYSDTVAKIQNALVDVTNAQKTYDTATADYNTLLANVKNKEYFADSTSETNIIDKKEVKDGEGSVIGYTVCNQKVQDGYLVYNYEYTPSGQTEPTTENRYYKNGKYYQLDSTGAYVPVSASEDTSTYKVFYDEYTYTNYSEITDDAAKNTIRDSIDFLKKYGALAEDYKYEDVYYDTTKNTMVLRDNLANVPGTTQILPIYYPQTAPTGTTANGILDTKTQLEEAQKTMDAAKTQLELCQATLNAMDVPAYVGNNALTPLSALEDNDVTAISQIIKDMREQDISTNITRCFDTTSGLYNADTYSGGIYKYTVNNTTYYTTYYDLANSYVNGDGVNHTDNQAKLPIYTATNVTVSKDSTDKAFLETDTSGRFTSIRLDNDTLVYSLKVEEVEDTAAYDDAMNQYDYNKALYDKQIADINAQTSLIQREDQDLELRLKQLDTEQNALNTEIDAVSKVVKDNIEKSFKTFGG